MNDLETMVEKTQFEIRVPAIDTSNSEWTITQVSNYHLTNNNISKEIVSYQTYDYANLGCYDLNVVKGLQNSETRTYKEAFKNTWSQIWLKNRACGLARLLKKEKGIEASECKWKNQSSSLTWTWSKLLSDDLNQREKQGGWLVNWNHHILK